jgi:hypothetical protein
VHRALVTLNSPADGPPVVGAVDYWRPDTPPFEPADGLWEVRVAASVQGGLPAILRRHRAAAAAVLVAAERVPEGGIVGKQGAAMELPDVFSTMVVEAAVHHLDLVAGLDRPGPSPGPLAEVRRVLEGLLGTPLPSGWDDVTAARRGTGRQPLTAADRAELGDRAGAFPLFG